MLNKNITHFLKQISSILFTYFNIQVLNKALTEIIHLQNINSTHFLKMHFLNIIYILQYIHLIIL